MTSDLAAAAVAVSLVGSLVWWHLSTIVEVTQCPGLLIERTTTIRELNARAITKVDMSKCYQSTMTINQLYELRRLQKALYAK